MDVATDMLGSGFWVRVLVRESGQAHSRSLLKKKWSDARAAWNFRIHERGDSTRLKIYFLRDGYLISSEPYPKELLE